VINYWQRGVPVYDEPYVTPPLVFGALLAALGLGLALLRMGGGLGSFSGMNDAFAWGVWKTFNVMTLTALGSGALAVGMAAWIFNRHRLHVVMRTALVTSLLFYLTGLFAIIVDIGRPWNFWNVVLPWRWNTHSALLEVMVCMPLYACIFLAFENLPMVLERFWYRGTARTRTRLRRVERWLRWVYPFVIAGAYILPIMHQSSLGALLLLAGTKIHPLWQTQFLPLLYLLQAGVCGFAFIIFILLISCLRFGRPLDLEVLGELGSLMSWLIFVFLGVRFADIAWRGQLGHAFDLDFYSLVFLGENLTMLAPAIALRRRAWRETPRVLLNMATLAGVGGMVYRFVPTTIAYDPGSQFSYFPSLSEILIMLGFISLALVGFGIAVKLFAVLPAPVSAWEYMVKLRRMQHPDWKVDRHGNPIDD
jgi:Ni/Fe-hydrogenase subunit HybB-like protein